MQDEDLPINRIRSRGYAAKRLNTTPRTIMRLEKRGLIRRVQITDKKVGYTDAELDRFIAERTRSA